MALRTSSQMLQQSARATRIPAPKVTPEQEEGLAKSLANKSLGWVATFGNLLSLPQSMVMDAINLQNPFDQLLTPTTSDNRTTGKDLLRNLNLIGDKDTFGNTVAGLAVDIATDPLTYMTLGASATTKGGQAAKAIGLTDNALSLAAEKIAAKQGVAAAEMAGKVGPRRAGMVTSLNDIAKSIRDIGGDKLNDFSANLDKFAKVKGYKSGVDFLAKHGNEPLRGLAGIGLPFMGNQAVIGTGEKSQKLAAGLDAVGLAVSKSFPGRMVSQLFKAKSLGQPTYEGQKLGSTVHSYREVMRPAALEKALQADTAANSLRDDFTKTFANELAPRVTSPSPTVQAAKETGELHDFLQAFHEGGYDPSNIDQAVMDYFGAAPATPVDRGFAQRVADVSQSIRLAQNELRDELMRLGVDVSMIEDVEGMFRYGSRSVTTDPFKDAFHTLGRVAPMSADMMRQRNEVLEKVPAFIIERMARRALAPNGPLSSQSFARALAEHSRALGKSLTKDEAQAVRNAVISAEAPYAAQLAGRFLDTSNPDLVPKLADGSARFSRPEQWANEILQTINGLPPTVKKRIENGGKMYDDFLLSHAKYLQGGYKVRASAQAILDTMSQTAKKSLSYVDEPSIRATADELAKNKMDQFVGMKGDSPTFEQAEQIRLSALSDAAAQTLGHLKLSDAIDKMNFKLPDNAKDTLAKMMNFTDVKQLDDLLVPAGFVDAAKSLIEIQTKPKSWALFQTFVNGATKKMKENLTLPFPSFFMRNAVSSIFGMNFLSGEIESMDDVANMWKSIQKMHAIKKDPQAFADRVKDLYVQKVTNYGYAAGDVELHRLQSAFSPIPDNPFDFAATTQEAMSVTPTTWFADKPELVKLGADALPSAVGTKSADAIKAAAESSMNMFEKARRKLKVGHEFALRTGEKLNAQAEYYARGGLFNFLIDYKGYTPAEAARKVRQIHVDYADLAPFEKTFMRPLFPFYTFARKQMVEALTNIAEHPGGGIATTIKTANRLRNPDGLTPDYVSETISIPLGETEGGSRNYLTGLGLAFEDPLSFFGKGIRGAGLETMSRMNPLLKGPMEYFTGQTFFQSTPEGGRSLQDTDPVLGRLLANVAGRDRPYRFDPVWESIASNSPLSRYLTTARTLTDTRKDFLSKLVNVGTGVRISTISPEAAEAILRERATSGLREAGGKTFVRAYIPDYNKPHMSPQELQEAQDLEALLNTLAERSRKRKQEKMRAEKQST